MRVLAEDLAKLLNQLEERALEGQSSDQCSPELCRAAKSFASEAWGLKYRLPRQKTAMFQKNGTCQLPVHCRPACVLKAAEAAISSKKDMVDFIQTKAAVERALWDVLEALDEEKSKQPKKI